MKNKRNLTPAQQAFNKKFDKLYALETLKDIGRGIRSAKPTLSTVLYGAGAVGLVGGTALMYVSCKPDPTPTPKECNCETIHGQKDHKGIGETACGGTNCDCTEQVATLDGTSIQIRKVAGVSVANMNKAVTAINTAYGYLIPAEKNNFEAKITEMLIASGNSITQSGTILNIGYDADILDIADFMTFYVAQLKQHKNIILANGKTATIDYSLVIAHSNAKKNLGRTAAQQQAGLAI